MARHLGDDRDSYTPAEQSIACEDNDNGSPELPAINVGGF
jgi:hypothetical protein